MKALRLFLITCLFSASAGAATVATLPARRASSTDGAGRPVMIDLSAELKKQNIGTAPANSRLVQVDLTVKASPTGGIIVLMFNGVAVSSVTLEDDREQTITLNADNNTTPAPWVLGVRGQVEIKEIRVTVDAAKTGAPQQEDPAPQRPSEPSPGADTGAVPGAEPAPSEPPPQTQPTPDNPANDTITAGQKVIVVSRNSGRIDYVTVVRQDTNGTYTVFFEGQQYSGFDRNQVALPQGCIEKFCVGQEVLRKNRSREVFTIIGRLPGRSMVIEGRNEERFVADITSLELSGGGQNGGTDNRPPANIPNRPVSRNFFRGQVVLIVQDDNRVFPANVMGYDERTVWVASMDGRWQQRMSDNGRIGILDGCAGGYCVGQSVTATDRAGRSYRADVVAIQSPTLVVLRLYGIQMDIGNWPVHALRR